MTTTEEQSGGQRSDNTSRIQDVPELGDANFEEDLDLPPNSSNLHYFVSARTSGVEVPEDLVAPNPDENLQSITRF